MISLSGLRSSTDGSGASRHIAAIVAIRVLDRTCGRICDPRRRRRRCRLSVGFGLLPFQPRPARDEALARPPVVIVLAHRLAAHDPLSSPSGPGLRSGPSPGRHLTSGSARSRLRLMIGRST